MIEGIKYFGKIQKDTYNGIMLLNCRRDFIKQMKVASAGTGSQFTSPN